ncbi:type II toxin-antitoxin system VapC family toxin [Mucilaginibacter sp. McL0603]|uniref:type II toxin-antitoxin system VapC family toxin n=1 Tax=Mucilaginibacter sp. McL0603 TaxID=3415670 RepID=UPI003CEAAED6
MAGVRYLLDTHVLIWFQENNPKIPERVMKEIQKSDNTILFSQVSLFEISIKQKIGKLPAFYATIEEVYQQAINDGFTFLNIQNQHIYNYNRVPLLEDHRDPFDRLLIATAMEEKAVILSVDEKISLYTDLVKALW